MTKSLKHLSFGSLRSGMSKIVNNFSEFRQESKVTYSTHDVAMSGFAMMYFQEPSLLKFQESLREARHKDNLKTLFDVQNIPKDGQMRNVMDRIDSEEFRPIFKDYFHRLQRGKHLEQYQILDGGYLAVIDGTECFSSNAGSVVSSFFSDPCPERSGCRCAPRPSPSRRFPSSPWCPTECR